MYRIEVLPGEETVLRTIEELGTAIRNGLVTPRSRIYHSASQKWLPIEFHPHYKKALELPERPRPGSTAGGAALRPPPAPPAEPAPAPSRTPIPSPTRSPAPSRSASLPPAVASLPLIEVDLPERDYPEPARPVVHRPNSSRPADFSAPRPSPSRFSPAPPSPSIFSPAPIKERIACSRPTTMAR